MLYIFEENDLLKFAHELLEDAIGADGNRCDCHYTKVNEILEEATNWVTYTVITKERGE